jgi:hypothetical protein
MLDYSITLETMCLFFDITIIAKNCRIKEPSAKVNKINKINYLAINYQNGRVTMVVKA